MSASSTHQLHYQSQVVYEGSVEPSLHTRRSSVSTLVAESVPPELGLRLPASTFYDPDSWREAFDTLVTNTLGDREYVALTHDPAASLNLPNGVPASCCVRVLPRLEVVKAGLRAPTSSRRRQSYEMWESVSLAGARGQNVSAALAGDIEKFMPTPTIWLVGGTHENEITVYEAVTGLRMMRIADPKFNVKPTALLHAPFRGLMDGQLQVIPIRQPHELLRLKESQLVNTDYVWVGFADGAIRLFPASRDRLRETDQSAQLSKGDLADVVFELPKYHTSSIVAITRSPCHNDEEGVDLSTATRLSSAIRYMTAASAVESDTNREHLSLMCTASVDSNVAIWDIRRIYRVLETMRAPKRAGNATKGGGRGGPLPLSPDRAGSVFASEVVMIDGFPYRGHPGFRVRSSCTLIKARPLMRLKGGVTGLKSLQWATALVTTAGYQRPRNVVEMTRDPGEPLATQSVKQRRAVQQYTRFERREQHRQTLGLTEASMQEVEADLRLLMPPLAEEPPQSLRVNLLLAGDNVGTVHVWNLDEELAKTSEEVDEILALDSARGAGRSPMSGRSRRGPSESPGRQSARSSTAFGTAASPSVQMSAMELPPASAPPRRTRPRATRLDRPASPTRSDAAPSPGRAASLATTATTRTGVVQWKPLLDTPTRGSSKWQQLAIERNRTGDVTVRPSPRLPGEAALPGRSSTALDRRPPPASTRRSLGSTASIGRRGATTTTKTKTTKTKTTQTATATATTTTAAGGRGIDRSRPEKASALPSRTPPMPSSRGVSPRLTGRGAASPSPRRTTSMAREGVSPRPSTRRLNAGTDAARGASPQPRGKSSEAPTDHQRVNNYLSRSAKCRIAFTGGVAVTGMAVDLPPLLSVSMRRLPESMETRISLLEEPSPEEVERRALENEFETLTEEKALFFVFQHLQLYVSVEGTVLNLRCLPMWTALDPDGRRLFQLRRSDWTPPPIRVAHEMTVEGSVELSHFRLQFRKLILEAHSQPVTCLFFDRSRQHLWVGRNDGMVALFSTRTKRIVSRLPHPCATVALGPPNEKEWERQQAEYIQASNAMPTCVHLEWHKETRGYPPAHLSALLPFCKRTQVALLTLYGPAESRSPTLSFLSATSLPRRMSASSAPGMEVAERSAMTVALVDGRSDLSESAQRAEVRTGNLLTQLMWCRKGASAVRRAQKDYYESLCGTISSNVSCITRELGIYLHLRFLRSYYDHWRSRTRWFRREHVLRGQRRRRAQRTIFLIRSLERSVRTQLAGRYFVRWRRYQIGLAVQKQEANCEGFCLRIDARSGRPTSAMMEHWWLQHAWPTYFRLWRAWVQQPRSHTPREARGARDRVSSRTQSPPTRAPFMRMTTHCYRSVSPVVERAPHDASLPPYVGTLLSMMSTLYGARAAIIRFSDPSKESSNVMDDSWMSTVQCAVHGADGPDDMSRRLAVLKFGLLALLQGLLSTTDDVLPNLHNATIGKEVISMLGGILLCLDYVTADPAEDASSSPAAHSEDAVYDDGFARVAEGGPFARLRCVVERALTDEESVEAMKEVAMGEESLNAFTSFAVDDSLEQRRLSRRKGT